MSDRDARRYVGVTPPATEPTPEVVAFVRNHPQLRFVLRGPRTGRLWVLPPKEYSALSHAEQRFIAEHRQEFKEIARHGLPPMVLTPAPAAPKAEDEQRWTATTVDLEIG